MRIKTRRWTLAFAAVSATAALSGIGASGAQALPAQCAGTTAITGQGSSLQGPAQDIWTVQFNINATGCPGSKKEITYDRSSSGSCLNGFGANGSALNRAFAFCGTDDAPSEAQITSITTTAGGARPLTVPVAQSAIAVVVNPPANCSVTAVTPAQVEQAFRGTTTNWTGLGGVGSGCEAKINRIVRNDSSGTTYQFKHYLGTINGAAVHGALTWTDLQGRTTPAFNTTWPHPTTTTSPLIFSTSGCASFMTLPCSGAGSGGGDEVRTVGATAGSIGYGALPDARAVTNANGATWPSLKWLKIIGAFNATLNPSTNGLSATKAQSNCTTQTNAYTTQPSNGVTGDWSQTYLTTPGTGFYPICTLTWDIAFTNYTQAGYAGGTNIARTVKDYLHYIVTANGGQSDALGSANDYATLPADVRTTATSGLSEITN